MSSICVGGFLVAILAHVFIMPSPQEKEPERTKVFGRLSYLTVQSNAISLVYHILCILAPGSASGSELLARTYPVIFALGVLLTPLYYCLDHFVPEKKRLDSLWIRRGWRWLPLGNHLEHLPAMPLALFHALSTPRAEAASEDILLFCGGYGVCYFVGVVLVTKRVGGSWVYPIFDELEEGLGAIGPYLLGGAVALLYVGLGFLSRAVAPS
jgi:hypothetical protein